MATYRRLSILFFQIFETTGKMDPDSVKTLLCKTDYARNF